MAPGSGILKRNQKCTRAAINGSFFVIEPEALGYIESDVMWEHAPMETLAEQGRVCGLDFLRCSNYQLAFVMPGSSPRCAISRKQTRQIPNF